MQYGIEEVQLYMRHCLSVPEAKNVVPSIEEQAEAAHVTPDAVYKWYRNENNMPLKAFPRIYRVTNGLLLPVLKLVVWLCDPELVIWRRGSSFEIDGSFQDEKDGLTILQGEITAQLNEALEDKKLDETERIALVEKLMTMRDTVDRYIAEVQHYGEANHGTK